MIAERVSVRLPENNETGFLNYFISVHAGGGAGASEGVASAKEGESQKKYLIAVNPAGKILGYVGFSVPDEAICKFFETSMDTAWEVTDIFVLPENRNEGVGRMLFEAVCDLAQRQDKKSILLGVSASYKDSYDFFDKVCSLPARRFRGYMAERKDDYGAARPYIVHL